jgi:hypothetical protein
MSRISKIARVPQYWREPIALGIFWSTVKFVIATGFHPVCGSSLAFAGCVVLFYLFFSVRFLVPISGSKLGFGSKQLVLSLLIFKVLSPLFYIPFSAGSRVDSAGLWMIYSYTFLPAFIVITGFAFLCRSLMHIPEIYLLLVFFWPVRSFSSN